MSLIPTTIVPPFELANAETVFSQVTGLGESRFSFNSTLVVSACKYDDRDIQTLIQNIGCCSLWGFAGSSVNRYNLPAENPKKSC